MKQTRHEVILPIKWNWKGAQQLIENAIAGDEEFLSGEFEVKAEGPALKYEGNFVLPGMICVKTRVGGKNVQMWLKVAFTTPEEASSE